MDHIIARKGNKQVSKLESVKNQQVVLKGPEIVHFWGRQAGSDWCWEWLSKDGGACGSDSPRKKPWRCQISAFWVFQGTQWYVCVEGNMLKLLHFDS